jgi:hypothetical protein
MYRQTVEIENETVHLTWDDNSFKNFAIRQSNQVVGTVANKDTLKLGARIQLPSKKDILVLLGSNGLELWYNGRECISNSQTGEINYFKQAGYGLILLGIIQCAFAAGGIGVILMSGISLTLSSIFLVLALLFFLSYIAIGFWGIKTHNKAAYWIGMGICILTVLVFLLDLVNNLSIFNLIWVGMLLTLAYYCYKATQTPPPKYGVEIVDENTPFDQV